MNVLIRRQVGLSIIEVMIALALSLIITLGLTQIFVSNSQTFRVTEASARIQESGRFATGILAREIRNTDYWGCLRDVGNLNSILNSGSGFNVDSLLRGIDVEVGAGAGGTDRLLLGGVSGNNQISVPFQPSQQAATLQVSDPSTIFQNDILVITDCRSGDIFQVTNNPQQNNSVQVNHNSGNVSNGPGNATQALSTNYNDSPDDATLFRPRQQRFYLRDSDGRRELVVDGVNVSGQNSGVGIFSQPRQLVPDVMDFQIELGVDSNGDRRVDDWEAPLGLGTDGRAQADSAISVRLSFLIRSPEPNVTDGGQSYCFPGWLDCEADDSLLTTAGAGDTFLYRVYTTTVGMRNRL